MKHLKALVTISVLAALHGTVSAQVSPFVAAQVDAAVRPCADLAGATAGLPEAQAKAVAIAALTPCYEALQSLDAFERNNGSGMTPEERNYFYFAGGNVIWMTAASETMKNDGRLNAPICEQVRAAEAAWSNVDVPAGTSVDIDMRTNDLRRMLLPACTQQR
ncbi:MAG: hypothetical protein ABJN69_16710 [Hellea sp.]